jgi:class 3 adenylate cyclase
MSSFPSKLHLPKKPMSERQPCPNCGHENEVGHTFCGSCGVRLAIVCASCGVENPLGHRYCGTCGASLAPQAETKAFEERRVITVLFADLVGFTSRAERLDPEDVRAILSPYYARLRSELEAFGGAVEKFIGDAVMAVFGAPVAHGDDPERAVRAALAIRDAMIEMNEADPELDLQLRVGVNTGEAIVTFVPGASSAEGMVAGDVVNTGSRLQSAAPVNGILVGEETYRATSSSLRYEEFEPVAAKGKQAPVRAWLALAAPSLPGERSRPVAALVGREPELDALRNVWERVVNERRPHLVTLFGASGIGKSRLADEFGNALGPDSARIVKGRSLPYGAGMGYDAFAQHIKQVAGIFDTDAATVALERLHDAVAGLVGETEAADTAAHLALLLGLNEEEVADRRMLFFSARRLVEELAGRQPLVLIFEDIHWAEGGLLDLLENLASLLRDVPVLLLTLSRPDLLETRPGWGGGLPSYTALAVEPLSEEAARELAVRLLPEASAANVARLAETSDGNPLFIEELAASLAERTTSAEGELPTSVRSIVSARLDALPNAERSLLLDASAIGKVFWVGALEQIGGDGDAIHDVLESLEHRDLLRREAVSRIEGDTQYSFKHILIREIAYATLPRAKRRDRHAAVAGFLEGMTGDRVAEWAPVLALHWLNAGDSERAVEYFLLAAEQAGRGWAKEEAVDFYERALEHIPKEDGERRRAVMVKRAIADQAAFHVADAERLRRLQQPQG